MDIQRPLPARVRAASIVDADRSQHILELAPKRNTHDPFVGFPKRELATSHKESACWKTQVACCECYASQQLEQDLLKLPMQLDCAKLLMTECAHLE